MPASFRLPTTPPSHPINRVAAFVRIGWPLSIGIGGRLPSESVAALPRIPHFEPGKFEDRYENALFELLNQKRKGEPIRTAVKPRDSGSVVNLMDALRKSLDQSGKRAASQPAKGRKPKKAASGQREMLMAIAGKAEGKTKLAAKETKRATRQRKAG